MSMEASGGGASGGNNVCDECSIKMDRIIAQSSGQRSSEEKKKIEKSNDPRFNEEERKRFKSFEKASEANDKRGQPGDAKPKMPKIQKAPSMLRDNNKLKKYFEPKVFSFSPFYHKDRNLKMAKQIKVNLAAEFLQQNGVEKEDLYEKIREHITILKHCYDDDLTKDYTDHKLAWMFLVDGCAILQFMYIISIGSPEDHEDLEMQLRELGIKTHAMLIEVDLFLLENQLPYKLLLLIIGHVSKQETKTDGFVLAGKKISEEDKLLKSIYKFISFNIRSFEWYGNEDEILKVVKHEHVHLLDLVREMHIQRLDQKHKKPDFIDIIMEWTADLFYKLSCNRNRYMVQFSNIGKLREAGINLKPSKTRCVTDISFIGGTLKLPPIFLNELTASTFLNILCYEMCPDFHNGSEFISYMYFLDKLIDRTKDVDELREKNILRNQLGRDEDVTELFNEIGSHLFPNYQNFSEVRLRISKYFRNNGFMRLRKVIHDIHQYFKNRWSLLALIAALLALATGIIQTVYTVFGLSP